MSIESNDVVIVVKSKDAEKAAFIAGIINHALEERDVVTKVVTTKLTDALLEEHPTASPTGVVVELDAFSVKML